MILSPFLSEIPPNPHKTPRRKLSPTDRPTIRRASDRARWRNCSRRSFAKDLTSAVEGWGVSGWSFQLSWEGFLFVCLLACLLVSVFFSRSFLGGFGEVFLSLLRGSFFFNKGFYKGLFARFLELLSWKLMSQFQSGSFFSSLALAEIAFCQNS